ncbi:MAG: ADP-ribosyltransferase [Andreesenia angusta]|nr:ADP-ribosyltransferase [Andreesenia angusta]
MSDIYLKEDEIDLFLENWSNSIKENFKNLNLNAFTLNFISNIIKSFLREFDLFRDDIKIDELEALFLSEKENNEELEEYESLRDAIKFLIIRINMYENREFSTKFSENLEEDIANLKKLYHDSRSLVEIIHYTGNSISFKNNFKEDLMTKFINEFHIPENIYLYRLTNIQNFEKLIGMNLSDLIEFEKKEKLEFTINNIISTSLKQFAIEDTNYETGDFDIFLRIKSPKGSTAFPTEVCSAIKGEMEVLLPIGTKFRIDEVKKDYEYIDGNTIKYFIECEII